MLFIYFRVSTHCKIFASIMLSVNIFLASDKNPDLEISKIRLCSQKFALCGSKALREDPSRPLLKLVFSFNKKYH